MVDPTGFRDQSGGVRVQGAQKKGYMEMEYRKYPPNIIENMSGILKPTYFIPPFEPSEGFRVQSGSLSPHPYINSVV